MSSFASRLNIVSRPLIFKRRGRVARTNSIAAELKAPTENRLIDAEIVHGDEQAFWSEKRWFYRDARSYMPTWDRVAQTMIILSKRVPRIPQEAAFRIFAVFLKVLLITKVTDMSSMMLPLWTTLNVQGLIQQAKKDVEDKTSSDEKEKPTGSAPAHEEASEKNAAASPASPPSSSSS